MDLAVRWLQPVGLIDGRPRGLIYDIEDLGDIPEVPGIYVFARSHGDTVSPLYIGKAENLRGRIEQQLLSNVRLMRGIEDAPVGHRIVHVGKFTPKQNQPAARALAIIESALISAALVEGYELINKQGKKTLVHTITSSGNRSARYWLPENVIKLRRAGKGEQRPSSPARE